MIEDVFFLELGNGEVVHLEVVNAEGPGLSALPPVIRSGVRIMVSLRGLTVPKFSTTISTRVADKDFTLTLFFNTAAPTSRVATSVFVTLGADVTAHQKHLKDFAVIKIRGVWAPSEWDALTKITGDMEWEETWERCVSRHWTAAVAATAARLEALSPPHKAASTEDLGVSLFTRHSCTLPWNESNMAGLRTRSGEVITKKNLLAEMLGLATRSRGGTAGTGHLHQRLWYVLGSMSSQVLFRALTIVLMMTKGAPRIVELCARAALAGCSARTATLWATNDELTSGTAGMFTTDTPKISCPGQTWGGFPGAAVAEAIRGSTLLE